MSAPEKADAREARAGDGSKAIARAAEVLGRRGLIAYPTETFYGIGADAFSADAVARVFALKGRPPDHPIPLILPDPAALERVARAIPETARRLAARFWPGPLTLVLLAAADLPAAIAAGTGRVGVRVSSHPVARGTAVSFGGPITATSANRSGREPPRSIGALDPAVAAGLDLLLDGGETPGGPPSTVLDVTCDPPRILRAGRVSESEIRAALGA